MTAISQCQTTLGSELLSNTGSTYLPQWGRGHSLDTVRPLWLAKRGRVMVDVLEILSTLFEFFAFVVAGTAIFCIPVLLLFWAPELIEHFRVSRHSRAARS